jgi:glycerol-1-phosphate dehydrogenase [NAD(P)+]
VSGAHQGRPIEVVIGEDALAHLAARARAEGWRRVLVVMDANTREAAGEAVTGVLRGAGAEPEEFLFAQREGLLAGPEQVNEVRGRLGRAAPLVAVGSGVITDIVRQTAHLADLEFVSVPTAASMDGYASSVAAMQVHGVKVTHPARSPSAIFADPAVAAAAPAELTRAGIGDLLAKATARVDWLASHLLYGEPFDPDVDARVLRPLTFAAGNAERLMGGAPEAVAALLQGLIDSGIAMTIVGSSRPASGCEHHASHFWDLLAARGMRAHASHGLQVGYATWFAMRLQRFAFAGGLTELHHPQPVPDPLGAAAREWLGEPTAQLREAVAEKARFTAAVPAGWPAGEPAWAQVCSRLAPALELFPRVESALAAAGIPSAPGYLEIDARVLRATFHHATRLRARFTVVDLLEGQGRLDDAVRAMLAGRRSTTSDRARAVGSGGRTPP